jgi:hypothetical protein
MDIVTKEDRVKFLRHVLLVAAALAAVVMSCKQQETTTATAPQTTSAATTTPPSTSTAFPSIPPVVISGNIPSTVPLPSNAPKNATPEQFRPYFDWFSWESFIALNWPPSGTGRGNPNQPASPSVFTSMTNTTPITWETYKANWELYDQWDKRPTPWNDWTAPYPPPQCPQAKSGQPELIMVSKVSPTDTSLNDNVTAFSFPVIDQQRNYVFFEVRYNQPYYDYVRGDDAKPATWLYYSQNLPTDYTEVPLPPNTARSSNSIMLKAAWRNLTPVPVAQRSRYYTINAWIYDPNKQQCVQAPMGLVGFHIAQKTSTFPEWIWSTFEQVDNVPPTVDNTPSSFNNGTNVPSTGTQGFANRPQTNTPGSLPANPTPVQVTRINPIPTTPQGASTVDVNNAFHAALPKSSPWQYYQLIVTQWPTNPTQFKPPADRGVYPSGAGQPFPVNGAVNVALETYFQTTQSAMGSFGNSCMSCHYYAANGLRDFSWGFARRPHTNAPPPAPTK